MMETPLSSTEPMSPDETVALAPPPESGGTTATTLRRRGLGAGAKPKSRRQLQFLVNPPDTEPLTDAQERAFLNMQLRKMKRRVRGRRAQKGICCELCAVIVLLIIMILMGYDSTDIPDAATSETVVTIAIIWVVLCFVVISFFRDSPYVRMLTWMVIYIPLLLSVFSFLVADDIVDKSIYRSLFQQYWLWITFTVLEILVFAGFMSYYKLYPKIVESKWCQRPGRAKKFWRVSTMGDWTMSYMAVNTLPGTDCQLSFTCKYEGDNDPDTGLPDGLGRWLDDSWEGEMLTGYWKQGEPVAPFSSWNVGTDDAVVGVRVGYFKATDDAYDKNSFWADNDKYPPECGVASVECNVAGAFYKHLPCATLIEGPYVVDKMPCESDHNPIQECLSHLFSVGESTHDDANHSSITDGAGLSSINIRSTDPRGIQVLGHVYGPTGRFFANDTDRITIDVDWGRPVDDKPTLQDGKKAHRPSARFLQRTLFMPKAVAPTLAKLVEVDFEDSSDESGDEFQSDHDEQQPEDAGTQPLAPLNGRSSRRASSSSIRASRSLRASLRASTASNKTSLEFNTATLRVQDWIPCVYKEALIFFPGYNSCMQASLQSFGQFLAMSQLSKDVYPFVFVWPGSYNMGYSYASKASATDINQLNVLKLMQGLAAAGIHRVHFMTHSMGVQTLMGAFRDRYDEHGVWQARSDVSLCFQADPEFDDSSNASRWDSSHGPAINDDNRLICKSITLLNPDFPLAAFVDRGFLSIRRVCRTITVVGDRNDRALFWSSVCNGAAPYFGYQFPEVLRRKVGPYQLGSFLTLEERIGRSFDKLYFDPNLGQQQLDSDQSQSFQRLLFNQCSPVVRKTQDAGSPGDRLWLDIDVIDMTGLDTNIKGMRHSGFSLNGMLLKDLEELISTGRRAMKRPTLLYREGNMFSYAHAPAFVAM